MIIKEVLQKSTEFLKAKNIETSRLDSELLLGSVLGLKRIELYTQFDCPLNKAQIDDCRSIIQRRAKGEPVAHILGFKDFYKSRFVVNASVLTPRPETELAVEEAVDVVNNNNITNIIDFGSGSGCLGLSIIKECSDLSLYAVDISEAAIEITNTNAKELNVDDRVVAIKDDVVNLNPSQFDGGIQLITANPPYIDKQSGDYSKDVAQFEPHEALFSDNAGLEHIFEWSKKAYELLDDGGYFICEIGFDQAESVKSFWSKNNLFKFKKLIKDYAGFDRILVGTKGDING